MMTTTLSLKRRPAAALLLIAAGMLAVALSACGDPDPIPVYVTPTPELTPTALPQTSGGLPAAETVLASSQARQDMITPLPTPQPPPPGVTFGPVTGSDYTPEPLQTALPAVVSEQMCSAVVSVPQATLYAAPDKNAAVTGQAGYLETVQVLEFTADDAAATAAGTRWARTPGGWITLIDNNTLVARLHDVRRCAILRGEAPDTTLLGLHVLNDTEIEAVLAFVRRMAFAGKPVGTIKGLNGTEAMLNEIKQISPETVTVYRSLLRSVGGIDDCPSVDFSASPDPAQVARTWISELQPYWDQVTPDYYEVINECGWPLEFLTAFSVESMRIANEQGRCVLSYLYFGSEPSTIEAFQLMLPAYRYALENPCANGRLHGIAMHAYSMQDGLPVSSVDKWTAFRHRVIAEWLSVTLPPALRVPVYITELGIGGGQTFPGCDLVIDDALKYTYQIEEDPYVDGFHLWSVGTGTLWYDIAPCLPALGDSLLAYYGK